MRRRKPYEIYTERLQTSGAVEKLEETLDFQSSKRKEQTTAFGLPALSISKAIESSYLDLERLNRKNQQISFTAEFCQQQSLVKLIGGM